MLRICSVAPVLVAPMGDGTPCVDYPPLPCTRVPPANCGASNSSTSCSNGVLDASAGETDVDCGGNCPVCGESQVCAGNSDCASDLVCSTSVNRCLRK